MRRRGFGGEAWGRCWQLLGLAVLALLLGCTSSLSQKSSPLAPEEVKGLEAIKSAFQAHDLELMPELCSSSRQVVAAKLGVIPEPEMGAHLEENPHEGEVEGEDHKAILIVVATPDESGEYLQPVIDLGSRKYFYEVLYFATVSGGTVRVSKSVAKEQTPARMDNPVEPELMAEIAARAGGEVRENLVLLK